MNSTPDDGANGAGAAYIFLPQGTGTVNPFALTGLTRLGDGSFQFGFTNDSGLPFTVWAATNVALPFNAWSNLGPAVEIPASNGQFQFTDPQPTTHTERYYRVTSP